MLKEAKKWVQELEEMLNRLAKLYNKSVEELDEEFENWYDDGGAQCDTGAFSLVELEVFESHYRANKDDEAEQKAYGDIYKKMREFADRRDYTLSDEEIDAIIEECEQEGDSIFDCSDGMLREIVEDWIADHS